MKNTKKDMTPSERKRYKEFQREGLESYYIMVQRVNPPEHQKRTYTKLVSRAKALDLIFGKRDETGQRKITSKYQWRHVKK